MWKEKVKEVFGYDINCVSDLDNYEFAGDKRKTNINRCLEKIGYKQCTECGRILSFDNFYKNGKYYKSKCKNCTSTKKILTGDFKEITKKMRDFKKIETNYLKELGKILRIKKKQCAKEQIPEWLEYKDIYSLKFDDKMSELNAFHEICSFTYIS